MIPVYEPDIGEFELANVVDCVKRKALSGTITEDYIGQFERLMSEHCGVKHGIVTTSGTTALALAVACLGLGPDDEVIVPAFTNIATALAVVYSGAKPVFADSEKQTWNIDINQLRSLITPKTKAIIPVHIFGHPVEMEPLMQLAKEFNLYIIEDAAEAQGAKYRNQPIGSFGQMSCFSFYINKIITTGEGGMVMTNDDDLAQKARLLKNLAYSNRDKFIHHHIGYNYRLTNLQAAMGVAQLNRLEEIVGKKRQVAHWYTERLNEVSGLQLPCEMSWAKNVYWVYGVVLGKEMPTRQEVRDALAQEGIETRNFFYPMNRQPVFVERGISSVSSCLPVCDWLWDRGLYLPSGPGLTEREIQFVQHWLNV